MRILVFISAMLALLALSSSSPVEASPGVTTRVSVASGGTQANGFSLGSAISADGRFVAFDSDASNLVAGDTNGRGDVFVHDRQTGATTRVNLKYDGTQADSCCSGVSAISADGRFVAFWSDASNLVQGDTNYLCQNDIDPELDNCRDIFVRDRQSGTTTRVSVDSAGNQANDNSQPAAISADGLFVAFESLASNLVVGDTNIVHDIFVRDRESGSTSRVSVSSEGDQANWISQSPTISGDGRFVAFSSNASNLVSGDTNICNPDLYPYSCWDIFVHDRQTVETTMVSVNSSGDQGNGNSSWPAISADGRFVAFTSAADNLVLGDTNDCEGFCYDIFVHDRQTGETTRVSVDSAGNQANGHSQVPAISADGRYVAFDSYASNLVAGDTNCDYGLTCYDSFVHDRQTGGTTRVSVSTAGTQANAPGFGPTISADGRFVAFGSEASNLVSSDTNNERDIFVHELGDADDDGEWDPFDPDDDNDTVPDASDNCPIVPNAGQADTDGDLAGDACDGAGSGNVDCSPPPKGVGAVDALKVLRNVVALPVSQDEPCANIGSVIGSGWAQGDVDCDADVDAVDALKILRAVVALSVSKPEGCPPVIGPPG